MLDGKLPFEIHITIEDLIISRQADFVAFCLTNNSKPLIIELSRGDCMHQPMLSKIVYSDSINTVVNVATELSKSLYANQFFAKRLKIEVPSQYAGLFQDDIPALDKYFEWHGKINYNRIDILHDLCEKHKAHVSLNALKNENSTRFITLREFGTKAQFEKRVLYLSQDLNGNDWDIIKQQSEYCIYDNNTFLDIGWLPQ